MIRLVLALIFFGLFSPALAATPVVGDLSNYRIRIDSGFNGTRLFVFGARNEGGDIVVVVRGPNKNYLVRKKESFGGIWINRQRMKFYDVPDFYAVASSKPLEELVNSRVYAQLGIGQPNVLTKPSYVTQDVYEEFQEAFLRNQRKVRLYNAVTEPVNFMAETLFKTAVEFPDNIPSGNYTAEIYLISGGELVGMQSTPIKVVKSGLDAVLHHYAQYNPVLYGITAVVMALGAGWLAARLFEKF